MSASAGEEWSYKKYEPVAPDTAADLGLTVIATGKRSLSAILPDSMHTNPYWGVEQVFTSDDLKSRLFVKQGVEVSDPAKLVDGWAKVGSGHVLHLRSKTGLWAFFAVGLDAGERRAIQRTMRTQLKTAEKKSARYWQMLIEEAYGRELVPSGAAVRRAEHGAATTLKLAADTNPKATFSSMQCARASLGGAWDATAGGAVDAAKFVWSFVKSPSETWNQVSSSFQQSLDFVANLRENLSKLVEGFPGFHIAIQTELVCAVLGELAGNGLMSFLTGGGNTARMAAMLARFAAKVKTLAPFLAAVSAAGEGAAAMSGRLAEMVRGLMKGELSRERTATMTFLSKHDIDMAMEAAACALQ